MINDVNKPNFFLVGAAKAGTTSLHYYLKKNKHIYLSPVKEPNYFCDDIKVEEFCDPYKKATNLNSANYFKTFPLKPLQLAFIRNQDHYNLLFKGVTSEKAIGESSTSYLYSHNAARNIYSFNKDAKIIIILRNPVERAFSHYLLALRYGFTHLSFKDALDKDISHPDKGWGKSELFIELGMYYDQIKRYTETFEKKHIKIILFDDLKNSPENVVKSCFEFLEVEDMRIEEFKKHNIASVPKNPKINTILLKSGIKTIVQKILPDKSVYKLKSKFFNNDLPLMTESERNFVYNIYKDDINKTAKLTGLDLNKWLK